jgi:hypothetical protein
MKIGTQIFVHVWASHHKKIHCQSLFTTAEPEGVEDSISSLEERVTSDMNDQFLKDFTEEEIASALP